jgi:hypothetical protein
MSIMLPVNREIGARLLTTAAHGVRIHTSLKNKMGDIIQNTLARQISIQKKINLFYLYICKHYKKTNTSCLFWFLFNV